MANQNGALILEALQVMKEPATVTTIANHIANAAGSTLKDVRQTVKDTLDGGVQFGYVQKKGLKYYAAPLDLAEQDDAEQSDGMNEPMEDRSGRRRRRRRSTSQKRKGSRVARRRSRSRSQRGGR